MLLSFTVPFVSLVTPFVSVVVPVPVPAGLPFPAFVSVVVLFGVVVLPLFPLLLLPPQAVSAQHRRTRTRQTDNIFVYFFIMLAPFLEDNNSSECESCRFSPVISFVISVSVIISFYTFKFDSFRRRFYAVSAVY